jgi:hypothetical protein
MRRQVAQTPIRKPESQEILIDIQLHRTTSTATTRMVPMAMTTTAIRYGQQARQDTKEMVLTFTQSTRRRRSALTADEQASTAPAEDLTQRNGAAVARLPAPAATAFEEPTDPTTDMNNVAETDEEFEKRKKAKIDEDVAIWRWIAKHKRSLTGCRAQALEAMAPRKRKRDGTE